MQASTLIVICALILLVIALFALHAYLALQVLVGLIVVWLVYRLSLLIMQHDRLVVEEGRERNSHMRVPIVDGYAMTATASDRVWNTMYADADYYVPLQRSFNRKGGAQFSYSFWMYIGNGAKTNVGNHTILLRGNPKSYPWMKSVTSASDGVDQGVTQTFQYKDVLVKCPQIAFGPTFDSFVVSLNTLHDPDTKITISPYAATDGVDGTLRQNLLKLTLNKWVLHTFVFEDNVAITEFEDGIMMRYYLNDTLYHTARVPSTLRQNNGDLHILPTFGHGNVVRDSKIGDVTYYNYALVLEDVREVFAQGPPQNPASGLDRAGMGAPLYLNEYNKLDVYNT